MEFDELLQHLADLRDLATSEGFLTFADACDDVVTFVESMPMRFERRLVELPAVKKPIAIVRRDVGDHDCAEWNSGGVCFVCRRPLSIEEQTRTDLAGD